MLSFTRRRALFLRYTSLPRVGRVLSVEGKEEDIYICAVSRQIFKVA